MAGDAQGSDGSADFAYGRDDGGTLQLTLAIFADDADLRAELREDALATGFRVTRVDGLDALFGDMARGLADIVLVDCPVVEAGAMAGLAELDMRAARIGMGLIVSTSIVSLDTVFGCLDQSSPQILVAPSRADRMLALGRALALQPGRVRELSEADRAVLMRLSDQVSEIGARLEALKAASEAGDGAASGRDGSAAGDRDDVRTAEAPSAFRFASAPPLDRIERGGAVPALPPARLVRAAIRQRQARGRFLPAELFADPAWDMLLDLTAAQGEGTRVSVTSLCIASGVPVTTALRWIALMTEMGLLRREVDLDDRRRAFILLSDKAIEGMARYFAAVGKERAPVL
ncbi:MAG: MarR family transcriptional regulator [Sphingomonadales bacterium]|nr:MarR family transcriptional regulator [Sphingomonadales bacterium]